MKKSMTEVENSVLVVAHPDDEVLWFASLLAYVDRVVIVFRDHPAEPGLGNKRKKAMARLPFETTCLALPEAGSYRLADWSHPKISRFGLSFGSPSAQCGALQAYEQNFRTMRDALAPQLVHSMNVYTHNPWGEYGHEDHVQVFRAIEDLSAEIGFRLRVSCYYSRRSGALADRYRTNRSSKPIRRSVETKDAHRVADIYKRFGCWTWFDDWTWPSEEYFIAAPSLRACARASGITRSKLFQRIPSSARPRGT